jgi:hypothetical protein
LSPLVFPLGIQRSDRAAAAVFVVRGRNCCGLSGEMTQCVRGITVFDTFGLLTQVMEAK